MSRMRQLATGVALVLLCVVGVAQSNAPAVAADPRIARVDALFAKFDRADSPGCALGIFENGRIVHERGFGSANLELGVANGPTTVFDIGSTSKQFTASCIALLAADGKLSLEDDVRKHIPELPDLKQTITLRNLLNHTSGVRDYLELFALIGVHTEDYTTKEQALALIAGQKALNFEPGTEFLYSNSGYFLLSIVVERVSGQTLPQFAHDRIFVPLGMTDTHIHDDHTFVVPRRAQGYSKREGGGYMIDMSDFEQTGDGGVMTTIEDLAKWDANFYEPRVGGRALIDTLQTKGVLKNGHELNYALGLRVARYRDVPTVDHGGAWAGYRAQLLRFPEQHVSIVCLCNLGDMDPGRLCQRVADVWLEGKLEPVEKPAPQPAKADAKSDPKPEAKAEPKPADTAEGPKTKKKDVAIVLANGSYECSELGVRYEISGKDGERRIGISAQDTVPLRAVSTDTYDAAGLVIHVARDDKGVINGFTVDSGRVRGLFFALR